MLPILRPWFFLLALGICNGNNCDFFDDSLLECNEKTGTNLPNAIAERITSLKLMNLKLSRLQRSTLRNLPNIEGFFARNVSIESIDDDTFRGFSKLDTINLSDNKIITFDPDILLDAVSLKQLDLHGNPYLIISKDKPILRSRTLTTLDLYSCAITEVHSKTFEELPDLIFLFLGNNLLSTLPADAFKNNGNLGFLDLKMNKFSTLSPTSFSAIPRIRVYLEGNPWNCDCHLTPLIVWGLENVSQKSKIVKCEKPNNSKWGQIVNLIKC